MYHHSLIIGFGCFPVVIHCISFTTAESMSNLSPPVASAAAHWLPLCWVLVLLCVPSGFAILSLEKRELVALLFLNVTSLLSSLSFPQDAMGSSVMCDCGIPWSDIYFSDTHYFLM